MDQMIAGLGGTKPLILGEKMFRCENSECRILVKKRQPENKVVTERRNKSYEVRVRRGRYKGEVNTVHGWEIAREIRVCPDCFVKMTGLQPKVVQHVVPVKTERQKRRNFKDERPYRKPRNKKNNEAPKPRNKPVVEFVKKVPNVNSRSK